MQSRSLQRPSLLSQVSPIAQGNSVSSQAWRQTPWAQTSLGGQRPSPSSTIPLQSLSTLSPFSGAGFTPCPQVVLMPPAAHWVAPAAQIPIAPFTGQGWPPPLHDSPFT